MGEKGVGAGGQVHMRERRGLWVVHRRYHVGGQKMLDGNISRRLDICYQADLSNETTGYHIYYDRGGGEAPS